MSETMVLAEDEVTIPNLAQMFKRAYFKTAIDQYGSLAVYTEAYRVNVSLHQDSKLIRFMSVFGLKAEAGIDQKHALTNRMNDEKIFCRFSIPETRPDVLVANYYLPFEEGVPVFQIVSALRLFSRVVPAALDSCDKQNLVE